MQSSENSNISPEDGRDAASVKPESGDREVVAPAASVKTESDGRDAGRKVASPKPGKSGKRKRRIWLWAAIVILGILAIWIAPLLVSGAPSESIIYLPENPTRDQVRDSISRRLSPGFADKVASALPLVGGKLRSGAWKIDKNMSPLMAARRLARGAQAGIKLHINTERTKEQLTGMIASKLELNQAEMLELLNSPTLLKDFGTDPANVIGLFLADTYEVYWTASPSDVLRKVSGNYKNFWTAERRSKARKLGLTPEQVVTLASIVDEESNQAGEKGIIGRLYINRLNQGMKLQADPTVRYALGDFSIKRVTGPMLKTDSPYNTYLHEGLPPGPIRVTSAATIDAILNSAPNDYIYMCAKEDFSGFHNFARDFETHQANARRYQQALDRADIH